MLMKNFPIKKFTKTGKSDPVSYVLSNRDHEGKKRSVLPEIIGGDEFSVRNSIENNHRKFKYTSGVLAFGDDEKPTQDQIEHVCQKFLNTFLPDNAQEQVPYLLVAHRDKGNLEIHYVVAREWVQLDGTTKAFNMAPPGKTFLQMKEDFVATTNHELGFNQVLHDPFKLAFSQFERLDKKESHDLRKIKTRIQSGIKNLILKGAITSREGLVDFLKENGTVTREGSDYISFKLSSKERPIRLRGEFFKEGADYSKLIAQYEDFKIKKAFGVKLNDTQYQQAVSRLDAAVQERATFNAGNFDRPKKSRTRAHLYQVGADGKKHIVKSPTSYKPKRKRGEKPATPVAAPIRAIDSITPGKAVSTPLGASKSNPVAQGRGRSFTPKTSAMGTLAGGGSAALMTVQIHQLLFSQLDLKLQLGRLSPNVLSDMRKIAELTRKIFEIQQKIDALKAKQEQAAEAELIKHLAMMKSGNSPYHTAKI
ncbi:hypothetical protein HFK89_02925 [Ralstonia pseudosolanacearum]|uniref:relaxase/mobilization nuclease domain-containing protein n=1 Tax=Ralstonia pseudosolanacearum TaxID=1310165 RepID=UPI0011136881|nr:hypothetical protein [Ralstonia pseudosolanacearum]MCK4161420.1 hypothetical protein [Ralstonia pseudosolanacearum]